MPAEFEKLEFSLIKNIAGDDLVREKLVVGNHCYAMYESKTPEQVVMLRKMEKMLGKMNELDCGAYMNFKLFDLTKKKELLDKK